VPALFATLGVKYCRPTVLVTGPQLLGPRNARPRTSDTALQNAALVLTVLFSGSLP